MEQPILTAGLSTVLGIVMFILYRVVGHRLVSDCCGRRLTVGVDVRDMPHSPEPEESQSYQPPSAGKKGFVESRLAHHTREQQRQEEKEMPVSGRTRRSHSVVVVGSVPVSAGPSSAASKKSAAPTSPPSDVESSLPPILLG